MSTADVAVDALADRVDRVRARVNGCTNTSVALGLAFCAANVQQFAAGDAPPWSLPWCAAWLIEPMVSALLLAVVFAEQVTSQYQVASGTAVSATKWGCFTATYLMNTWESWRELIPSGVVLHSVPPVMVLLAAEVGPELRDRLTAALHAATATSASPTPSAAAEVELVIDLPDQAPTAVDPGQDRVPSPATVAVPAAVAGGAGPEQRPDADPDPDVIPVDGQDAGRDDAGRDDEDRDEEVREDGQDGQDGAVAGDVRVRLLGELLDAGCEVTGPQAAVVLTHQAGSAVSARTARRLLAAARTPTPSSDPSSDSDGDTASEVATGTDDAPGRRPHLHLLPPTTSSSSSESSSTSEGDPS